MDDRRALRARRRTVPTAPAGGAPSGAGGFAVAGRRCAAGRAHAAAHASTTWSARTICWRPGRRCAAWSPGGGPMTSVILWGPPGTGKTTIAHLVAQASDRRFVALSALNAGREGRARGDRRGPTDPPHRRRGDRAVHRRGAPLLQDPAGLAAVRGRGRHGDSARGDHREPVLLDHLAAAVAVRPAHPAAAGRRRRARPGAPGAGRRARPGRRGHAGRRRRGSPGTPGRRRRAQGADRAGGGRRRGRGARASTRSTSPPPRRRWTGRRCATTGTATPTTTW